MVYEEYEAIGSDFEYQLLDYLRVWYPDAVLMHDIWLPSFFLGEDTQIDIVMVHSTGVYVFEAKNFTIYLDGRYDSKYWIGMSRSRKELKIISPFDQNVMHIRALRNALYRDEVAPTFHNIVVVPDRTQIRAKCSEVRHLSEIKRYIDRLPKQKIDVKVVAERIRGVTHGKNDN